MFAVIFEVNPTIDGKESYLELAARLRCFLEQQDGLISIERFHSLSDEGKLLSLSFWRDETAIAKWRNFIEHRAAQKAGYNSLFHTYRIRVAKVLRDYTDSVREEAPSNSNKILSAQE